MFNGLKKIVGKSNAILDGNLNDDQQNTSNDISLTPVKTNSTKKRKVIEKSDPLGLKKKYVYVLNICTAFDYLFEFIY